MIQAQKLILNKTIHFLLKTPCRGMCKKKKLCDMIGTSDRISNLHPIKYAVSENETHLEKELRRHREELQSWNEVFWTKHNLSFIHKKKEFERNELNKKSPDNQSLTADELSVFYKQFLDENWKTHLKYLLEWYRRNIFVTYLHLRVNIQKIFHRS